MQPARRWTSRTIRSTFVAWLLLGHVHVVVCSGLGGSGLSAAGSATAASGLPSAPHPARALKQLDPIEPSWPPELPDTWPTPAPRTRVAAVVPPRAAAVAAPVRAPALALPRAVPTPKTAPRLGTVAVAQTPLVLPRAIPAAVPRAAAAPKAAVPTRKPAPAPAKPAPVKTATAPTKIAPAPAKRAPALVLPAPAKIAVPRVAPVPAAMTVTRPRTTTAAGAVVVRALPTAKPVAAAAVNPAGRLASCLAAIPGRPDVLLPSAPDFLVLANGLRTLRTRRPAAVVFPTTVVQVQRALGCAAAAGVAPIPRSGGFSPENLSSGDGALVVDLSSMANVTVNLPAMTATVQMGARHGNMYHVVTTAGRWDNRSSVTTSGAGWPQLGVGGVMAAGGYGPFTRKHGLFIDGVLEAKVVLANGNLVTASPTSNPDLFWAIRGGGGGTYGIVTEATVRLYDYPVVTVGALWLNSLIDLAGFMDRFQRWAPTAPADLTFNCNVWMDHIQLKLIYVGRKRQLDALMYNVSGLTGFPGSAYASVECDVPGARWWLSNNQFPPVCGVNADLSMMQRVTGGNKLAKERQADKWSSGFFRAYVPAAGWKELASLMENWGGVGVVVRAFQFKAYGGYMSTVADDATPFPHRKGVLMSVDFGVNMGIDRAGPAPKVPTPPGSTRLPGGRWVVNSTLPPDSQIPPLRPGPAANDAAIWAWYQKARAWVAKYGSPGQSAGYASYDAPPFMYYLGNYARLRAVKRRYDPLNVFHNVLSVPAA